MRASWGRIIGRKESEIGEIGVSKMQGTDGWTIEPEHESEYAVEPVGVAKIKL